jgi:hypothetical protein
MPRQGACGIFSIENNGVNEPKQTVTLSEFRYLMVRRAVLWAADQETLRAFVKVLSVQLNQGGGFDKRLSYQRSYQLDQLDLRSSVPVTVYVRTDGMRRKMDRERPMIRESESTGRVMERLARGNGRL